MTQGGRLSRSLLFTSLVALSVLVAACSTSATATPSSMPAPTPIVTVAPSEAPSTSASAAASSASTYTVAIVTDAKLGKYLAGEDGKTLYTFKKDTANTSNCNGGCATAWPPFVLESGEQVMAGSGVSGALTTFARTDGSMQVAYNGTPLYYYATDQKAGDVTGQGVGGVWFVAAP